MGTCGPDFTVRVLDACTGDPIPAATVQWWSLGPYVPYPGATEVPCAVSEVLVVAADGSGLATVADLWMNSGGTSQQRVNVSAGTPGEADFRYGSYYLDNSMVGTVDLAAWPSGGCPPVDPPSDTGGGSCGDCGELSVITGPRSSWPMGYEQPVGYRGMGHELSTDRCTVSSARVVGFTGQCFPVVEWCPVPDLGSIYAPGGDAPLDWHQAAGVVAAGAATVDMIRLLLENQAYLSTQLFTVQTQLESVAAWCNQMNEGTNVRLLLLNETLQLLGTVLHGEGWVDRVHVSREDPYSDIHPPFGEGE